MRSARGCATAAAPAATRRLPLPPVAGCDDGYGRVAGRNAGGERAAASTPSKRSAGKEPIAKKTDSKRIAPKKTAAPGKRRKKRLTGGAPTTKDTLKCSDVDDATSDANNGASSKRTTWYKPRASSSLFPASSRSVLRSAPPPFPESFPSTAPRGPWLAKRKLVTSQCPFFRRTARRAPADAPQGWSRRSRPARRPPRRPTRMAGVPHGPRIRG